MPHRRSPSALLAVAACVAVAAVPSSASAAVTPKLAVSAQAAKAQLTVRVRATVSGTATIAVRRSGKATVGRAKAKVVRGRLRTFRFRISSCAGCTKVDVVSTLKARGAKAVTRTVAVPLAVTTTTTTTTTATRAPTTVATGPAPAPRPAPATTTTTRTTTATTTTATTPPGPVTVVPPSSTVSGAPETPAASGTEDAGSTGDTDVSETPARAPQLAWAPPVLTSPTTVKVSASNRNLKLDSTKDYIISMPSAPLSGGYGLVINGGRNVVLIGGEIDIPWQGATPPVNSRRGLYLLNQTGTVHVEGLWIHGDDLSEGIDLDERGADTVVQIQNVRIDGVHARDESGFTDNHPDLIQTWGGPNVLRVDHLSGSSDYQGFFFAPMQFGTVVPKLFDLRNVDISAVKRNDVFFAGYLLWQSSSFPMSIKNLYVVPDTRKGLAGSQYPKTGAWAGAQAGTPVSGSYVAAAKSGVTYNSAGYAAS